MTTLKPYARKITQGFMRGYYEVKSELNSGIAITLDEAYHAWKQCKRESEAFGYYETQK